MRIFKIEKYIKNNVISASVKRIRGDTLYHGHEFLEIEFVIDGTGCYEIDGVSYEMKKNTVFIMNPSNIHSIRNADAEIVNVMFLRECDEAWFDYYSCFSKATVVTPDEESAELLKMMFVEIAQNSETAPDYAMNLLNCAFYKLSRDTYAQNTQSVSYVSKAISYLQNNFNRKITLERVAQMLGLSQAYFSDLFRKETGINFKEYLDELRFSYVKRLLEYTELSVKEVYIKAGFTDYSNFARRFKARYDMTPSEYRAKKRSEKVSGA